MNWLSESFDEPLDEKPSSSTAAAPKPKAPTPAATPKPARSQAPAPAPSNWLAASYETPVATSAPKKLTVGERLSNAASAVGDLTRRGARGYVRFGEFLNDVSQGMVENHVERQIESARAVGRGFTSAAENLLVHAPTAYLQGVENLSEKTIETPLGSLSPVGFVTPEGAAALDRGQANIAQNWNQPLQEITETAEDFWAAREPEQRGFFEQLRRDPARALAVGLSENAPQLLVTVGASAVNPAAGLAVAGGSEAGAAWDEAKQAGASDEDAATAAGLTALPNLILEYLPAGRLIKKLTRGVPQEEVASTLGSVFKQAWAEGSTEVLQEANSVLAGLATYAGDRGLTWHDVGTLFSPENLSRYGAAGMLGFVLGGSLDATLSAPASEPPSPANDPIPTSPAPPPPPTPTPTPTPPPSPPPREGRVVPFPIPPRNVAPVPPSAPPVEPLEPIAADPPAPVVPREPEPRAPKPSPPEPLPQTTEPDPPPREAPPPPEFVVGRRDQAFTERGGAIEFDYALVEAGALRTSHDDALDVDPTYPQELQPRDRDRAASALQVSRIEQQLNPALVGASPKASDGAPIVGEDGLVEGGNARSIGIRRAYRAGSEKAAEYRAYLRERAESFGLAPEQVDALQEPVLVRVRRTEVPDRAELARELNESGTASMSATERARSDAARISPEMLDSLRISESGELSFASNRAFVEGFASRLSPAELGSLYDASGALSVEGQNRVRNALLARAFDDADAVAKLIESPDNNVRAIGAAMLRESPRIAQVRAGIEQGALHDRDLAPDIAAALTKLSGLRAEGSKVDDYLAQGEMFGAELTPEARELLTAFDRHARSGRKVGDVLRAYSDLVASLGHPQQAGLFGTSEAPSKLELLRTAVQEVEIDRQRSLFGDEARRSGAGRAYFAQDLHRGVHDPEATKLWRQLALLTHPDRATSDTDRERRNRFLVEANNAYEVDDLPRLREILEAWNAGDDIAPRAPRRPRRPTPPPNAPNTPPPANSANPSNGADSGKRTPRRSVDTEPRKLRLELPEIVEVAQHLGEGKLPRVVRALVIQGKEAFGGFYRQPGEPRSGEIRLDAQIAADPELAAQVLAHEIGHWVDHLPDALKRGNLLGSLASLRRYMKTMLDELPSEPSRVFTNDERARYRREALRAAREELGVDSPRIAARAREIYLDRLEREMVERRLVDQVTVRRELVRVSTEWRGPFLSNDPYRNHPRELYADGFSALLNDPDLVKRRAPTFHSLFFNYLDRKPQVKEIYEEIQLRIEQGPEALLEHRAERYLDMVRRGGQARAERFARDAEGSGITLAENLVDGLIDRKSKLYRDVARARKAGRALDPERNPLHWVEEAAYHSSEAAWYLDRLNEEVLKITRGAGVTDTELGAVLGLNRAATERGELFNPLGEQGEHAGQLRGHLLKRLGREKVTAIRKARQAWWALRKEVLDRVAESQAFTGELILSARKNPDYVKFFVAHHLRDAGASRASGNVHHQVGTLQEIGNPVVETALADLALLRIAHRTESARAVVSFYRQNFQGEIQRAKRGKGGQFLDTQERGRGTIFYLEHGKVTAVYASERIVSFFEADSARAGAAYRTYNLITRPLRALFVDRNPFWAFWNLAKDAKAFAKQTVISVSPNDGRAARAGKVLASPITASIETFRHFWKALPEAGRDAILGQRGETLRAMQKGRMLVETGSVSAPRAGDDVEVMDVLFKKFGVIEAVHHRAGVRLLERMWNALAVPGKLSERMGKIAGYEYLRANQERLGLSNREIAHRVRTLAGTPDVMRRGEWFRLTNSVFLFSNVSKEGYRSALEAARLSPGEYAMKTLAFDIAPKLAMIAFALGWGGEELKEWFAKLPEYDKANFLIIPLGTTPEGKAIYTRIPHDHIGQMLGGLLWRSFSDERSAASLFEWMDQNFPYSPASLHPYVTTGWAIKDYAQGKNPTNSYTGEPMILERAFAAGGERSHRAFLRALWGEVGLSVLAKWNTEEPSEVATQLEKALDLPLLGPALARFVKVSDRGTTEKLRKLREEEKSETAKRSLDLDDLVKEGLDLDPEASAPSLYRAAKEAGLDPGTYATFKRRVLRWQQRRSADPYERALSYTTSKKSIEKIEAERQKHSNSR